MDLTFLQGIFYEQHGGRTQVYAMPIMIGVLCILAIAYRYYSAFLAARVAALDDTRETPAHTFYDGQNYHPTNRWVLFGHHFAAISGAGPLIGPVLAIQFGYFPGLLWLVIGVCLAGAVQDMLVLAVSVRNKGKSLAEIARAELGPWATIVVSAAILFIVIIALAGLGIVVVKALGGEEVKLAKGVQIKVPQGETVAEPDFLADQLYKFPPGCEIRYTPEGRWIPRPESFVVKIPFETLRGWKGPLVQDGIATMPEGATVVIPGSSWGTFTIACTIPIALFVGLYMYKIRKGRVVEASILGALGVVAATIIGNFIPGSPLEPYFSLTREHTIMAIMAYGFIASVLPVWLLLCPRDYLSSFLKIGTIILIVIGIIVANPTLKSPPINEVFANGGPTFSGAIFPFVFICIMCGAVSGFHALVSSGTTPKMINRETDIRAIGYGAMLMEGLVGVVALIAAASLDPVLYYDMNVDQAQIGKYQPQLEELYKQLGVAEGTKTQMHEVGMHAAHQLPATKYDLGQVEEMVGGETLRGRTGGAVTLAVSMALIFTDALSWTNLAVSSIMKYWYHFVIMFEALFILTTIDTGTRIARFLLQETMGKVHPKFAQADWLPSAVLSTALVTLGWGGLIWTGSISTIWPMFGIANQLLAVIALSLVTTWLINNGRKQYAWVTILPMAFVITTTMTAGAQLVSFQFPAMIEQGGSMAVSGVLNIVFTIFVNCCVLVLLFLAVSRWAVVSLGLSTAGESVRENAE